MASELLLGLLVELADTFRQRLWPKVIPLTCGGAWLLGKGIDRGWYCAGFLGLAMIVCAVVWAMEGENTGYGQ